MPNQQAGQLQPEGPHHAARCQFRSACNRAARDASADYRPPEFLVDTVALAFDLDEAATLVRSRMAVRRNPASRDTGAPLSLDGEALTLVRVTLNGEELGANRYRIEDGRLLIPDMPDAATLEIETRIAPKDNTELSGLYTSNGSFFTQCEAEGFRRITYFPDRPDVMARFTTTITADATRVPVMLSNGNPGAIEDTGDGRHRITWVDPHPKPSYLFALVAGDLVAVKDHFVTRSGRHVELGIWVRRGDEDRCAHAMRSLKTSMKWDEDVFGLEYDLDVFNIAAVSDFNMGAMENKGLNVFNTKYVLAKPETATDGDYQGIEAVIAHEYFHNWTGNRVTCRDWFQLSLKEGLTVYRDQEFSADQGSRVVKRIGDVRALRAAQFREDAGPLAHRCSRTTTSRSTTSIPRRYTQGAEVIRMMATIIGAGIPPRHGPVFRAARQSGGHHRRLRPGDAGRIRRRPHGSGAGIIRRARRRSRSRTVRRRDTPLHADAGAGCRRRRTSRTSSR
jgi:aminopeptidase N